MDLSFYIGTGYANCWIGWIGK